MLLTVAALSIAWAMAPACVLVSEQGTAVELALRVTSSRELRSADGVSVDLAEGWLNIADAALVACPSPREAAVGGPLNLRGRDLWLGPSRARAHHAASAVHRLAAPQVVALTDREVIGMISPAVGRYCGLEVIVTPSDDLDGWSLRASGTADGNSFGADGYASRRWELPLEPLSLDVRQPTAAVELALDVRAALEQTRLAGREADQVGLDLLLALEARAEAHQR